ncbi:MAG: hypothetical protein U1E89_04305 [Burkholderiaceae bacterium]
MSAYRHEQNHEPRQGPGEAVTRRGGAACRQLNLRKVALSGVVALTLSGPAHADFACAVTVQSVLSYYEGSVNVLHTGRGDWTFLCNLETPRTSGLTVQPTTCMVWTTLLLRAKKNNQQVQFWFPGTGSCATIATYGSAPVPTYVGE